MSSSFLVSKNEKDCINCKNCLHVCKFSAVQPVQGKGKEFFPQIDQEKCVNCGACLRACPIHANEIKHSFAQEYAVSWSNTEETLKKCSSGGVFAVLADKIIQEGGWVFGTEFNRTELAVVKGYSDENIRKFSGSKYVKSDVGNSFEEIKKILLEGKKVLFGGTPCQCDALRCYLGKEYDKLYLVDIICHGSPRSSVFESYLTYLEKKEQSKVVDITFRNKDKGWKNGQIEVQFENGHVLKEFFHPRVNQYANVFYSNIALTPGCNECKYNSMNRAGDLTLGDFWGYKSNPEIQINENGTSVILLNSQKGKELLEELCKDLTLKPVERKAAISNNPPLYEHTKINPMTDLFVKLDEKFGFAAAYVICLKILKWPAKVFYKLWRKVK